MLVWPAAGRRRDAAVAVVLKIMVAMVVLVRVFCTTDKGEVSLTDLMLWNQNAAGRGRLADVQPELNNLWMMLVVALLLQVMVGCGSSWKAEKVNFVLKTLGDLGKLELLLCELSLNFWKKPKLPKKDSLFMIHDS